MKKIIVFLFLLISSYSYSQIYNQAQWIKITRQYSDFSISSNERIINLYNLDSTQILHGCKISRASDFLGGGIIDYAISVEYVTDETSGSIGEVSVYTDEFDTTPYYSSSGYLYNIWSVPSGVIISAKATSTGGDLDEATQGTVDIWLLISTTQ